MLLPGHKSTRKRSANVAEVPETSVSIGECEFNQSSVAGLLSWRVLLSRRRVRWNTTSRKDRAIGRILVAHGYGYLTVAKYIGFSTSTVGSILKKQVYQSDDKSMDHRYLDDKFRARFPEVAASVSVSRCYQDLFLIFHVQMSMKRTEKKPKLEVEVRLPSITVKRVSPTVVIHLPYANDITITINLFFSSSQKEQCTCLGVLWSRHKPPHSTKKFLSTSHTTGALCQAPIGAKSAASDICFLNE